MRGPDVTDLQHQLNKLHFLCGKPDGWFGRKTKNAVKRLQQAYGLRMDGVVGVMTQNALDKDGQLSKHFHVDEFFSKGNGDLKLNQELITRLESLRKRLNRPIHITSGYRDPKYNRSIGGARFSMHLFGRACDFTVSRNSLAKIRANAIACGFKGVGTYRKDGFTHVDIRLGRTARWWG